MKYPVMYNRNRERTGILTETTILGYDLVLNDLSTASFALPVESQENELCSPFSQVEVFDGENRVGLFRIAELPDASLTEPNGVVEYSCEHIIVTLADDIIDGKYEIDGAAFTTKQAIEALLAKQTTFQWELGVCELNDNYSYIFEDVSLLEALFEIPKAFGIEYKWTYDTSVFPWQINLLAISPEPASEARKGRNLQDLRRKVDTSDVITRLYCRGINEDGEDISIESINPTGKRYIDADTSELYGIIADTYKEPEKTTPQQLYENGLALLNENCNAVFSYSANVIDLYQKTGDAFDKFEVGNYVRLVDTHSDISLDALVVGIRKKDVYGNPLDADLAISNVLAPYRSPVLSINRRLRSIKKTAENGLKSATQSLSIAEVHAQLISDAEYQIGQAEAAITDAEDRLDEAETLLSSTAETVTQHGLLISATQESLASKADKTTVDALAGTVSTHSTQISQNAANILLKADQTDLDTLEGTVSTHGTQISQNAIYIALKADQTEVNTLSGTVSSHSTQITQNASEIAQKADQTDVDTLEQTVTTHSTQITQNATDIAAKASQSSVNALDGRVTTAEANLALVPGQISLAVAEVQPGVRNLVIGGKTPITVGAVSKVAEYTLGEDWEVGETYTVVIKGAAYPASNVFGVWRDSGTEAFISEIAWNSEKELYIGTAVAPTTTETAKNILSVYNVPNDTATGARIDWIMLLRGNRAQYDFIPAPEDPVSRLKTSGLEILPDELNAYGASIDLDTQFFNLHDGEKSILEATTESVILGSDYVYANKFRGPVVSTHPGGAVSWNGSFYATLRNLPKYLETAVTINVPAGTYNEDVIIRGFKGNLLRINLAAGVTINGRIIVEYCDRVEIYGASDMTSIINVSPVSEAGVSAMAVKLLWLQYLRVTGRARSSASDGTNFGIFLQGTDGWIRNCIVERTNYAICAYDTSMMTCSDNRGGVSGGDYTTLANLIQGVRADRGSHIGMYGTTPIAPTTSFAGSSTIVGTGTPTSSPGAVPPPPTTVVRNYMQSVAAGWIVQNPANYAAFYTSFKPQQGVSKYNFFGGLWMLPVITNVATATIAKLTITRATESGSTNPVLVKLLYTTEDWSTISAGTYDAIDINELFTNTGHEVALVHGESVTIELNSTVLNLLKNGTIKGFGLSNYWQPWVVMEPDINLEVTTAS